MIVFFITALVLARGSTSFTDFTPQCNTCVDPGMRATPYGRIAKVAENQRPGASIHGHAWLPSKLRIILTTVRFDPEDGSAASDTVPEATFLDVRIMGIRPPNGATGNSPEIVLSTHTPVNAATFGGKTTRQGHDGKGRWGGTWTDNAHSRLHGTFGWTASHGSATLLGTWTATAESDH